jgi:prophage tail gpP-like protein
MARKRALNEAILGNANLWAGQRSLIVGHLAKPFSRQIKERIKNMQQTVYNPQKGRLETINIEFTDENTTSFDDCEDSHGILSITDLQAGILITEADYTYPLYLYDISRADIGHDQGKARALHRQYIDSKND